MNVSRWGVIFDRGCVRSSLLHGWETKVISHAIATPDQNITGSAVTSAGPAPEIHLSHDTDYLIDHMTLRYWLCNHFGPRLSGHLTKAGPRLIHGWLSGLCAGVNTGESVSLLLSSLSSLCDAIPFHIHLVRRFLNRISFSYFDSVRLDFLTVLAPRLNCIPREYYLDTL